MASFSPSEVAMTGFGVVRRNPQAVLIWIVLFVALQLSLTYLTISLMGPALNELQSSGAARSTDPAKVLATLGKIAPAYALMVVVSIPMAAVLSALWNRVVLRPKDSAFGFLRLGADEFRQIGLFLLYFAVLIGAYIAFAIVAVVIAIVGELLKSALGGFGSGLFIFLGIAAEIIFGIAAMIRLSLASALTFDQKKVDLFGSWAITKGHAWSILGAYFLALIIGLVVSLIGYAAVFGVAAAVSGGGIFQSMGKSDIGSVNLFFTPGHLALITLGAALQAITHPIFYTVAPAIYQELTKPEF